MHDVQAYSAPRRSSPSHRTDDGWGATTVHAPRDVPEPRDGDRRHLTYAPGLDGVRALAVSAVVVFHLGASWLPGGFLGVDVFFTLSGFLITSILLTEFFGRGRISIGNFYLRRARRLLPALFTVLGATTLLTWLFARDELHRLRGDVGAALTYCTNWTQIVWGRSYFERLDRPSLLQHLWSLAVEEQFYVLWPLVLVACLAVRRRWIVLAVPAALTVLSLVLMATMFHAGQDPARVYYGSDTHVSPMLIGALVAIVVRLRRHAGLTGDTAAGRLLADVLALAGLVGLAWACVHVGYYTAGLYRGGYLFVGIGSAMLIYAAGRAGTLTARLLGRAPLVWIGQRSYAIYLWHWPVLMLTRPGIDVTWPRGVVIVLQLVVVVVASDLSYRYIERPIRSHGFRAFVSGHRRHGAGNRRPVRIGTILVGLVALVAATLMTAPAAPAGIQVDRSRTPTISIGTPTPAPSTRPSAATSQVPSASKSSAAAAVPPPFRRPVNVSFFGDSQAMTLLLNKQNGLDGSITTSDSTIEGCGTMTGVIHSRAGYTRDLGADCGGWHARWQQSVAQRHPQIAVVELGAWDVFDETVHGRDLKFGSPGWDAYFSGSLHQGIDILTGGGAQVALMGVPCYRPIAAGGLPLLPERGDDTRTRHLNVLLSAAAASDPTRVFMIHPPAAFCDNPKIANDVNYRWDGTHYYKPGAALVFQGITPQLLAIQQPPH
ncbi:MAG: acyltransferase family protein [Jatrophihabitantaceae bacterium]